MDRAMNAALRLTDDGHFAALLQQGFETLSKHVVIVDEENPNGVRFRFRLVHGYPFRRLPGGCAR